LIGRQEGRKAGRYAGGQKCGNAGRKTDKGTEGQMYKDTYRKAEIKTYRHTQTNRQTDGKFKSVRTG
jgi:hypothetical protein